MTIFGQANPFQKFSSTPLLQRTAFARRTSDTAQKSKQEKEDSTSKSLTEAYQGWSKRPSPEGMTAVLGAAEPVIRNAMTSYAGGEANAVLRGHAKSMAIHAVKSYDPSKGASLKSWMFTNLQGLQRYAARSTPIAAPERIRLDHHKIEQAANEFRETAGYEPEYSDLEQATGIPAARIRYVKRVIKPVVAESQLATQDEDGEHDNYLPGAPSNSAQEIWAEYVYHDLPPMDKKVYDFYMGRNGYPRLPVTEIARRLGVSTAAISQRGRRIADRLAEGMALEGQL